MATWSDEQKSALEGAKSSIEEWKEVETEKIDKQVEYLRGLPRSGDALTSEAEESALDEAMDLLASLLPS